MEIKDIFKEIYNLTYNFGTIIFYDKRNEVVDDIENVSKIFVKPKKWLISYHDDDKTFHIYVYKIDKDFNLWFEKIKKVISSYGFLYTIDILGNPTIGRKRRETKKTKIKEKAKMKEDYLETKKKIKKKKEIARKLIDLMSEIGIDELISLLQKLRMNKTKHGKKILIDDNMHLIENILSDAFEYFFENHNKEINRQELNKETRKIICREKIENEIKSFDSEEEYEDYLQKEVKNNHKIVYDIFLVTKDCNCDLCKKMRTFVEKIVFQKLKVVPPVKNPNDVGKKLCLFLKSFETDDIIDNLLNKEEKVVDEIKKKEYFILEEYKRKKREKRKQDHELFKGIIKNILENRDNENVLKESLKWANKNQISRLIEILEESFIGIPEKIKKLNENCQCVEIDEIVLKNRPRDEEKFLFLLGKTHGEHTANKCKRLFLNHPLQTVSPRTLRIISIFSKAVGEMPLAKEIDNFLSYIKGETTWNEKETIYKGPIDNPEKVVEKIDKESNELVKEQFLNIVSGEPLEQQSPKSLRMISRICEDCKEVYLSTFIDKYLSELENETI